MLFPFDNGRPPTRYSRASLHGDVLLLMGRGALLREITRNNNLELTTYRSGAVSGKTDFHVDISKSPRGE